MGDVAPPVASPVAQLAAQVNRFGPGAPAQYQYAPAPFPLSSTLEPGLAMAALLIYLRRSTDAYAQFHDSGTATEIDAANAGFADPVGFISTRVGPVTAVIGAFADSLGLPGPSGASSADTTTDTTGMLILAAGVLGLWWMMEGKR